MLDSQQIKQWALDLGFDLVGIAPAQPVAHHAFVRRWLQHGYHADMQYLPQQLDMRLDPRRFVPGARSIICTALNYYNPPHESSPSPEVKVARYAWGHDYHLVLRTRLRQLARQIQSAVSPPTRLRCCADTAPLMEKYHAARAGLGWIGKNTLLINPTFGSWLVLGEIVTDLPLDYDLPVPDRCGSCRQCLDVCPNAALVQPRTLDARRCLAYHTLESRQPIPPNLRAHLPDRLLGCDLCQEACPFNQHPQPTRQPEFQPQPSWSSLTIQELADTAPDLLQNRFTDNALARANWPHISAAAQHITNINKPKTSTNN